MVRYVSNPKVFKTSTVMRNLLIAFEILNSLNLNLNFAPYELNIATVKLHQSEILLQNAH